MAARHYYSLDLIKVGGTANVIVMLFSSNHRITRNKSGKKLVHYGGILTCHHAGAVAFWKDCTSLIIIYPTLARFLSLMDLEHCISLQNLSSNVSSPNIISSLVAS